MDKFSIDFRDKWGIVKVTPQNPMNLEQRFDRRRLFVSTYSSSF